MIGQKKKARNLRVVSKFQLDLESVPNLIALAC